MIKHILFLFIFLNLLISQILQAQTPPDPTGRRLRIIVADKYPDNSVIVGGTTGSWAFGTNTGLLMDREYSYVTPENDFKQWNIHPNNTSFWNWVQPDAWTNHISVNGQILRMHCPISPQCSQWAQDDIRTSAELNTNMTDFMQAVCQRYDGVPGFEYMDVVNETVVNGNWHTDKPGFGWECPWFKIGQDTDINATPLYITKAFQIANQYAPNIKFIFNHHESPGVLASWTLIKETIVYLRNLGLRVDGIGWQAHVDTGWDTPDNLQHLRDLIDWAHNNQLEFHVTEASAWLKNGHSQTDLQQQAQTYRAIMDVLIEKRSSGKVGWNTWHIDDGHGWRTEWFPALFDNNYIAKPAYYAIQDALENPLTGLADIPENDPHSFQLYDNYPNPFNPETNVEFGIGNAEWATLAIYDLLGRKVKTLVNKRMAAGSHTVKWDGTNDAGALVASGIYLYRLSVGGNSLAKKMLFTR